MQSPTPEPIRFYGDPSQPHSGRRPRSPISIAFLTSVRDTGTCDRNGSIVKTPEGLKYMEGIIERTVNETREGGALHGILRVAGIITDDLDRDMIGSAYPVRPHRGKSWIHNVHLRNDDDSLIIDPDTTHWVPSDFRLLPLRAQEERADRKLRFEQRVATLMEQLGADVLVSDHYMARIAYLMNGTFQKFGRVLNIHPAVTIADHPHCFRGKTPTADAIARARTGEETHTGATLHFVDEIIDHGPPIAYVSGTPVRPTDEPQHLRERNYRLAKLPLFIAGMQHYVRNLYPRLDDLDLSSLSPLDHASESSPV